MITWKKRLLSFSMLIGLLFTMFTVPVSAAYENTHVNTGNQAYDIFCVAFTQVGYAEGNNNKTKYGEWYPMNYNPWCAMFVSWCAEQAGIPTSVVPKHASCDVGVNWFKNKGRWYNSPYHGGSYTPVMGDLIYFGVVGDSDHVGIVHSVSGGRVYTIEGNASDMCIAKNYDVGSSKILGYGHPAYTDTSVKIPDNNINTYKGTIVTTGVQSTSVDASLSGEIIGGGASASALTAAFDGNTATVSTLTENSGEAVDCWMGLKLSSAVVPTAFRISVSPHYRIFGSYVQASNDGANWTTLKDLSDWRDYATPAEGGNWPAEDVYKTITVSTSTAYRYYRYFNYNNTGGNALAEFQVFGPDGITPAPSNSLNTYIGSIVTTGVQATSVDNSVTGEIIGGGASASELTAAFDGNTDTAAVISVNYGKTVENWMGIRTASAVVPTAFRLAVSPHWYIHGSYIQGSNDGVNWTTLVDLSDWREYATPAEGGNWPAEDVYKTMTVSTSASYRYFRYFNYNDAGANRASEFQVFGPGGIVVHNHTMSYTAAKAATCTTAGSRAAYYCTGCGNYYADAGGTTKLDTITIDALGHSMTYVAAKAGTCTTVGTRAAMYCSRCNAYYADMGGTNRLDTIATALDPDNHTGGTELRNASEATATEEGYTGDTCCVGCGTVLEAGEVIPATGPAYLPGDINGNGVVDIDDAFALFRHSMLPEVYGMEYAGEVDYTGDGAVDLRDARYLFQYSMLPDVYPIA